jgi:hypothetical protein
MVMLPGRRGGLPALMLALLLGAPAPAAAQYFGRQKVQYETFDWQVMRTPKFDIHFYPEAEEITRDAARMAERWYERLSRAFQHEFDRKPLIFYADHPDFQQTNVIAQALGESTGGVTESLRNRVIMPWTGVYAENDHVLGHELVHVFQYDIAQTGPAGGLSGLARLPLWLIEGMAEYLSLGRDDPHTAMWLRDAALRGELPTLDQLTRDPRFFPYRYGQALWAYIAGRWGDRAVPEVYRFATRNGFEAALQRVLGISSRQLSEDWIAETRAAYLPLLEGRQRPGDAGDPVIVDDRIGAMNLAPVVSPDGRHVAFFGRRNVFAVDLLVADAETGRILRSLTSPNRSEHYDALSFMASAGTWSPDASQFAFVVFEQGDNRLAIMDIASTRITRRVAVEGVGAISNPAWSPDGRSIAFTGQSGGLGNLYVLDLESDRVRQLTDDRYAALQPTWSPDGRTIVFATDRGPDTDLSRLVYGRMGLAFIDVASEQVRLVRPFDGAKHINPQFSPSGEDLFFIADPDGFSDVYRLNLPSGRVYRVTRIATGVSGITGLSPAMSVSQSTGRMLFSVFENSGNNIYGLDAARTLGDPVAPDVAAPVAVSAGVLPPLAAAGGGLVHDYLNDPLGGLPASADYDTRPYRASIGLEYLGPPSIGVGVSSYYGPVVGGGVSAFFGDMLGDHFLGTAIQASGTIKDIGGEAVYYNMRRRLNWGIGAGHIPYLTGFVRPSTMQIGDQVVRVFDQFLDRIFVTRASLLSRYPFSTTQRFEVSGGFTRYGFDREIERYITDLRGRIIDVQRFDTAAPPPLYFFEGSAAFVGDNSNFGFTSPLVGRRYRVEVSPTVGTLKYYSLLGDYRRYFLAQPFTVAFRGMHYGRYGQDSDGFSEDRQQFLLSPIYLGYETLVRGYSRESFSGAECRPPADRPGACPAFDRLIGSRIAVANFEVRVPLFGVPELGLINFPFLPTELSAFVDAGVAWSSGDRVSWEFARQSFERIPVVSTGVSARFNLLGYLILETYYAYPFQRPDKGAHFGVQLAPGW